MNSGRPQALMYYFPSIKFNIIFFCLLSDTHCLTIISNSTVIMQCIK